MNKKTTAKSSITKNALSKTVTKKVAAKKSTSKKAASKKIVAKQKVVTAIEPQLRYEMITKMAYFRAKERFFESGHEVTDWLESEKQIDRMLINE